ncbi:BatD family protein [Halochromatium roseum]|uniref:BatD family protein n=1 Tax=Halochromatium roseum TaxID=391920 RepID=UPI001913B2A8|nr:BatD family protein [Halochromatium roseum]
MCWATATTAQGLPTPTAAPDAPAAAPQAINKTAPLAEQIQVEASTDRQQTVVGQQIVLRVLVIGNGPLPPGRLIPPNLDAVDLLILGEDRRIARHASSTKRAGDTDRAKDSASSESSSGSSDSSSNARSSNSNGIDGLHERWIYERRYALFPRSTGRLEIPPSVYSAWRPGTDAPEALRSKALSIEVRPVPPRPADVAADSPWLPATALSLNEAGASAVRLAPGQVIERMLTIEAVGLRAEDLPPIRPPIPLQLEVRKDAPRLWNKREPQGVTGYRTERITLSSTEPGLYQLPAVTLDWWDVDTQRWQQASTPEWQLQVAAFESASRRPAPDWRRDAADSQPDTNSSQAPVASVPQQPWLVAYFPWIIGTFGLLLIAWLLWRLYHRSTPGPSHPAGHRTRPSLAQTRSTGPRHPSPSGSGT